MNTSPFQLQSVSAAQSIAALPVLLAFLIGSLPMLLPYAIFRLLRKAVPQPA